jgi:hypothetical protein
VAIGRVVAEEERVHLRVDEVVDRHDLNPRRTFDECLERLASDAAEAVDADANCHLWTPSDRHAGQARRARPISRDALDGSMFSSPILSPQTACGPLLRAD